MMPDRSDALGSTYTVAVLQQKIKSESITKLTPREVISVYW